MSAWLLFVALSAVICFSSGCGGDGIPRGSVQGTVTVEGGAPVERLRVVFYNSMTGHGGAGVADEAGHFRLPAPLPVGDYAVFFEKVSLQEGSSESEDNFRLTTVDQSYTSEEASPLKMTVNTGENDYDIDVPKSKRKKRA